MTKNVTLDSLENAINSLTEDGNREAVYISIADYDPTEGNPAWLSIHDKLIEVLERKLAYVKFLKTHTCEYGHNNYCVHCGMDGNA